MNICLHNILEAPMAEWGKKLELVNFNVIFTSMLNLKLGFPAFSIKWVIKNIRIEHFDTDFVSVSSGKVNEFRAFQCHLNATCLTERNTSNGHNLHLPMF